MYNVCRDSCIHKLVHSLKTLVIILERFEIPSRLKIVFWICLFATSYIATTTIADNPTILQIYGKQNKIYK